MSFQSFGRGGFGSAGSGSRGFGSRGSGCRDTGGRDVGGPAPAKSQPLRRPLTRTIIGTEPPSRGGTVRRMLRGPKEFQLSQVHDPRRSRLHQSGRHAETIRKNYTAAADFAAVAGTGCIEMAGLLVQTVQAPLDRMTLIVAVDTVAFDAVLRETVYGFIRENRFRSVHVVRGSSPRGHDAGNAAAMRDARNDLQAAIHDAGQKLSVVIDPIQPRNAFFRNLDQVRDADASYLVTQPVFNICDLPRPARDNILDLMRSQEFDVAFSVEKQLRRRYGAQRSSLSDPSHRNRRYVPMGMRNEDGYQHLAGPAYYHAGASERAEIRRAGRFGGLLGALQRERGRNRGLAEALWFRDGPREDPGFVIEVLEGTVFDAATWEATLDGRVPEEA